MFGIIARVRRDGETAARAFDEWQFKKEINNNNNNNNQRLLSVPPHIFLFFFYL